MSAQLDRRNADLATLRSRRRLDLPHSCGKWAECAGLGQATLVPRSEVPVFYPCRSSFLDAANSPGAVGVSLPFWRHLVKRSTLLC